eukprot:Awhi_evm1s10218
MGLSLAACAAIEPVLGINENVYKVVMGSIWFCLFLFINNAQTRINWVGRSGATLVAGTFMVIFTVISAEGVYTVIGCNLPLLFVVIGNMVFVYFLETKANLHNNFFNVLVFNLVRNEKGEYKHGRTKYVWPLLEFSCLYLFTCVYAAFIGWDTAALALASPTIKYCQRNKLDVKIYCIGLTIACNIGSFLTPVGNPGNTLVLVPIAAVEGSPDAIDVPDRDNGVHFPQNNNITRNSSNYDSKAVNDENDNGNYTSHVKNTINNSLQPCQLQASPSIATSSSLYAKKKVEEVNSNNIMTMESVVSNLSHTANAHVDSIESQTKAKIPRRKSLRLIFHKYYIYPVLLGAIICYFFNLEFGVVALSAAVIALVLAFGDFHELVSLSIHHDVVYYIMYIFVTIQAFIDTGVPIWFFNIIEPYLSVTEAGGMILLTIIILAYVQVTTNVPAVLILAPQLVSLAVSNDNVSENQVYFFVAIVAGIGGLLTPNGSITQLIVYGTLVRETSKPLEEFESKDSIDKDKKTVNQNDSDVESGDITSENNGICPSTDYSSVDSNKSITSPQMIHKAIRVSFLEHTMYGSVVCL